MTITSRAGLAGFVACALAMSTVSLHAAEPLWGINGHPLTSYPGVTVAEQLDLLVGMGLQSYRVDVTSLDQIGRLHDLIEAAKQRKLSVLPILIPPVDLQAQTEGALYAAARQFAEAVASPLKTEVPVWELGNELEIYALLHPCEMRDDGTQYPCAWGTAGGVGALDYFGPRYRKVAAVLRGLSEGVKNASPSARRALGSAGWGHLGVFDRLRDDGVEWEISVWHMYGGDSEWAFKRLAGFGKPIWVTEFNQPGGSEKGEDVEANGVETQMLALRRLAPVYDIEAGFIYELCDETYWLPSIEAVMGLVHLDKDGEGGWRLGDRKIAFQAVRKTIVMGSR